MYLRYRLDDNGKRVYTFKVRNKTPQLASFLPKSSDDDHVLTFSALIRLVP